MRYSYSSYGSRVDVCDIRFSVLVSVTSNKVLVVVLVENVVLVVVFVCESVRWVTNQLCSPC